jgi:hypothetical protein
MKFLTGYPNPGGTQLLGGKIAQNLEESSLPRAHVPLPFVKVEYTPFL